MNILKYIQIIFFVVMVSLCDAAGADLADNMADCAKIKNDAGRLKCYDDLTKQQLPVKPAKPGPAAGDTKKQEASAVAESAPGPVAGDTKGPCVEEPSVMSRQWELGPLSRKNAPVIRAHNSSYFLPLAYNTTPNRNTVPNAAPSDSMQNAEAKYQISFKTKLWEDVAGKNMDLWFGYTQLAFWQMYNSAFSAPFRDTNYEPELLLNFRTDYDLLGLGLLKGRIINVGFNHQSNGRAGSLSRSWNRIVANFGFEKDNFNLFVKTWYRIPESTLNDDNPGIEGYTGYGEIWGSYYWKINDKIHKFDIMFRNNLRLGENRGAVQLDWAFPLPWIENDRISGYLQYFNGYAESLLDYNASSNRFSIGFMLTDWK